MWSSINFSSSANPRNSPDEDPRGVGSIIVQHRLPRAMPSGLPDRHAAREAGVLALVAGIGYVMVKRQCGAICLGGARARARL